jgi:hypothetical protein
MMLKVLVPPRGDYQFVRVPGTEYYRRVERQPVVAAYDSAGGIEAEPAPVRKITPAAAARLLQFLAAKLSPSDFAACWPMVEKRVNWSGHAPPRRNGKGGAVVSVT